MANYSNHETSPFNTKFNVLKFSQSNNKSSGQSPFVKSPE